MHRLLLMLLLLPALAWGECTQSALSTEFNTDPTARGYATPIAAGSDQGVLDLFNAPCTVAACKVDRVVTREQFLEVIDPTELTSLLSSTSANDLTRQKLFAEVMKNTTFDMSKASIRQTLKNVFPSGSYPLTNAAITALQQKDASRAQVVCGRQGTLSDVSLGLRGAQ